MYIRNLMKTDFRTAKGKALRQHEKELARRKLIHELISVAILGFFAGTILTKSIMDTRRTSPNPSSEKIVQEVKADAPIRHCDDKLSYIRCAAIDAGLTDKDASTLIRIARAESGCKINEQATNKSSTASGMFQILWGTWNSNKCQGNAFSYKDATDCAIKIYKARGTQPWETSAHQKSGNGWADQKQCL